MGFQMMAGSSTTDDAPVMMQAMTATWAPTTGPT